MIAANSVPDHNTIARFRADHEDAIAEVFVEVLALCGRAGMANLGHIAIDGTKVGSDAVLDGNRGAEAIRAELDAILGQAAEVDAAEDQLFGEGSIHRVPEGLSHSRSRLARLRAALAQIEQAEARPRRRPRLTRPGCAPRPARVTS